MRKELLIIGMSPGNSYFSQEVIDRVLPHGLSLYETMAVFIPDVPAISTYVALGYPENIARRKKAIPQGNNFRNKIDRAIDTQRVDRSRVTVFNWKEEKIEENKDYRECFEGVKDLYQNNEEFRNDINSATKQVLVDNPFKKKEIILSDIETATHYIISEFAFMVFLPKYKPEYAMFIYGYHKPWPVWENFIAGKYDGLKKDHLQFLKLPDFS